MHIFNFSVFFKMSALPTLVIEDWHGGEAGHASSGEQGIGTRRDFPGESLSKRR